MNIANKIDDFVRPSKESETLLINQISLLRSNNKEEVFKFGFGQSPFPVPKQISESLAKSAYRKEYMSVQGHEPLRKAIAKLHNNLEGKNWQHENIIIGSGSKILIFSVMAAFEKAEVLLPAPSWVSYEPQAKLIGHPCHWIETSFSDRWRLTPKALDEYCKQRTDPSLPLLLVLNYPNNPTGQTFDENEIKALAKVMKKHKIIVIADEIYSLLKFDKHQYSIADYYPEGCIVSSGLSKWCGAGGWRLGFVYVPPQLGEKLFKAIIGVASETYSCAPSPIQVAATTAYSDEKNAKDFLAKQIELLLRVNNFCHMALNKAGIKVHTGEGGFYLFPDFSNFKQKLEQRNIFSSSELTATLMDETGVALLPGSAFGMPESSLTARLAYVDFDGSQIDKVQNPDFEQMKKGINKLCSWVSEL